MVALLEALGVIVSRTLADLGVVANDSFSALSISKAGRAYGCRECV